MSIDSVRQEYNREHIYIVEIDVPRCTLTHGSSPCTATETGDDKCFNTLTTCNDVANYDDTSGSNYYTYYFCTPRAPHPFGMSDYAPCVEDVSIAPAKVDPKGGIGARSNVSISFSDFPSSDRYDIDPYLSDRTYTPLNLSLFWLKWRARNENYENYPVRIRSGYIVDNEYDVVNFDTRYYVLSQLSMSNGKVRMTCKDPLQLVSNKKPLAPAPSDGQLTASLTAGATSFSVSSGTGSDYGTAPFYVKIRDEVILVNTRSGDSFSSVTRGQKNTTASAHDQDDTVQLCLDYDATLRVDEVISELLTDYAKVPSAYIPSAAWQSEAETYMSSNPNRLITTPTDVRKLLKELSQEWPHQLYWNDRENQIELNAIKIPVDGSTYNSLSGDDNILELSLRDRPDLQLSTVFVRYAEYDPTKKGDEPENYQVSYGRANTDVIARYDSDNTKVINARWIISGNGGQARKVAQLWGRRFGFMPREINFTLDDKDSTAWLGDIRTINYFDIVDQNGNQIGTDFEILSAREGALYDYNALEYTFSESIAGVDDDIDAEVIDLSVDEAEINLRTKYDAVYGSPSASTDVKFIVYGGVVISSDDTANHAIDTGTWPAGATITLEVQSGGIVCGKGGNGGSQANGTNGGPAINLQYDLTLVNNGTVGGGGGGGGGAEFTYGDTGGGGGAGFGDKGTTNTQNGGILRSTASDGSATAGGGRGRVDSSSSSLDFITGGRGGDLGEDGEDGVSLNGVAYTAGTAGKGADLNGNTLTQSGNAVLGTVS